MRSSHALGSYQTWQQRPIFRQEDAGDHGTNKGRTSAV